MVFSETTRPIDLNFHIETPYDRLAKISANCFGHMAMMTTMPIYGKNPLKSFFLQDQKADDIGTWY